MTSPNVDDLIMDGAQLSCQITVERGKRTRIFHVDAYPDNYTRIITNNKVAGITLDPNAVRQCRWYTVGIIQFHTDPETQTVFKLRADFLQLEITLEHCLDALLKKELAKRAKDLYGLEFTPANFEICRFKKFIAKLKVVLDDEEKVYFGTLFNYDQLFPIQVIFSIGDIDALLKIASKLKEPSQHNIVLEYEYGLSGITAAHAFLRVTAEQINQINLERKVFGNSQAKRILVSRSYLEDLALDIAHRLTVVETIGVGGSSFGNDLIKQEITNAITTNGFRKFSNEDIQKMKENGTLIMEDLKADKITSLTDKKEEQSKFNYRNSNESSMAESSESSMQNSDEKQEKNNRADKSSTKIGGKLKVPLFKDISAEGNYESSTEHSSGHERLDRSSEQNQRKTSYESSKRQERSGGDEESGATERHVQGEIRQPKNFEAAIIERSKIQSGFTVSMARWQQHLAQTSKQGALTTRDHVMTQEVYEQKTSQEDENSDEKKSETTEEPTTTRPFQPLIKKMADKQTLTYNPQGIIMGRTGAGKTTLVNKLCGRSYSSGVGLGRITKDVFHADGTCGKNVFSLIDTPGIDRFNDMHETAHLLTETLMKKSINTVFIIIKYEPRFDKILNTYSEVHKPFAGYENKTVVMVSHWDQSKDAQDHFSKLCQLFDAEGLFVANIISYSEHSSSEEIADLMYRCMTCMDRSELRINEEDFIQ